MDISHFFERPILIRTIEWDDGTNLFDTISPWFEYFSHPTIAPKLLGFSRFNCELCVEIRINGSPFRFSQVLASYRPLFHRVKYDGVSTFSLSDYSGGYIPEDGVRANELDVAATGNTTMSLMARSQRQCAYLDVSSSRGCEFVFPFFHPYESMRVNSLMGTTAANKATVFGQELLSMGTLTLESLSKLRNLQVATAVGVTLDVFVYAKSATAWLASGVSTVQPQGTERKPSDVASSMASTASIFKNIPIIGSYATLAELLLNTSSKVLQFFGYTPRPDIALPQLVTGYSYPVESSVTFPKKVRNLGLDHQNGVVVDPAVIGGSSEDLLSISSFTSRSVLLCRTYFGSSLSVGDSTFLLPISPMQYSTQLLSSSSSLSQRRVQMTPSALAALNFRMWRGTMVVRFQAIVTPYHRGRLRLTWEPEIGSSTALSSGPLFTTFEGYQQMVNWDISASDVLTVKVGFGGRKGRLAIPRLGAPGLVDSSFFTNSEDTATNISTATVTTNNYEDYFNGFLRLSVLTRLQAPDVSYPVPIMVHVSFEDLELYDPIDNGPSLVTYTQPNMSNYPTPLSNSITPDSYYGTSLSSEDIENFMTRKLCEDGVYPQGQEVTFQPTTTIKESVYEGEKVGSLRSLLMRDVFYDTLSFEIPFCTTSYKENNNLALMMHNYIPPVLISCNLPVYPHAFGTNAPIRSTVNTFGCETPDYRVLYSLGGGVYAPNMARTNLFPLLRECFLGFRGSYNWKITPVIENSAKVKLMSASRSNYYHSAYASITPYPVPKLTCPFTTTSGGDLGPTTPGPNMRDQSNSVVLSLGYDTGTTEAGWFGSVRSSISNASNKLNLIRRTLNSFLGSFAAGGLVVNTNEQSTLGIRVPFFSTVKYHPGSTTGWFNSNSNSELSQTIRLQFVTESTINMNTCSAVSSVASTSVIRSAPPRANISLALTCSAGDDISFGGFVNVPALYLTSTTVFTDAYQPNS